MSGSALDNGKWLHSIAPVKDVEHMERIGILMLDFERLESSTLSKSEILGSSDSYCNNRYTITK